MKVASRTSYNTLLSLDVLHWSRHAEARQAANANPIPAVQKRIRPRKHADEMADGQLVTLALNGDKTAFAHLINRYSGQVRGIIGKRVRSPDEAAELVQDTLLSAWSALQTYPAVQPFETWLICIALNKCRDWGRRRSVRQRSAIYLQDCGPQAEPEADTAIIEWQGHNRLRQAVQALPQALREPLILTALQELPHREVAERLGLTVKAVETRVRRARQQLQAQLCEAYA